MENLNSAGWQKMLDGWPWYNCSNCYRIAAYSEFMPSPLVGRKPYGEPDHLLLPEGDPLSWVITEREEEYELIPGLQDAGRQIMDNLIRMGRGIAEHHIHGHDGENLTDNPYWPPELASRAGTLSHERFISLLPVMLSRTQDDKGRVSWSFFGSSTIDPEIVFWKNFPPHSSAKDSEGEFSSLFSEILSKALGVKCSGSESLVRAGFRILESGTTLPEWAMPFLVKENPFPGDVRYLLTFKPFSSLPVIIKDLYLTGKLMLIPFPGSLVFWGMPGYEKLKMSFGPARQVPLLNLVLRKRGIGGLRVSQSGWFHEPKPGVEYNHNPRLLHEEFHRTHRWQRIHRYQDELNEEAAKARIIRVLFSTEPDALGLYDKPMARNSHIWDHHFGLVLDGPNASGREIMEAEKVIVGGGLYGYRFFYPPMRVGEHHIYLHRILASYLPAGSETPQVLTDHLKGYITGYHRKDRKMADPIEMWPQYLRREPWRSAIKEYINGHDHYNHQTSLNIISLLEASRFLNGKNLPESFARRLLSIPKEKKLAEWLEDLATRSVSPGGGLKMRHDLSGIIEPLDETLLPEAITYSQTAGRQFEENWWNDIRYLAHGEFINKDNADIAMDSNTQAVVRKHRRDLESLGDYLINRHRNAISEAGMEGVALCGELPFKWDTDFDFSVFGGWKRNQEDEAHERNILVVIPGRNRKEAVVLGDHYDTAYMEDIYDRGRGGSGARLSANGADDNYSATSTILQAAPIFLRLAKEGRLERDIWLIHLTGEEFPSDCLGARNFCQMLVENRILLHSGGKSLADLSGTRITGVFIMDMIGHNRDNDLDIFQISPGDSGASLKLAWHAHIANLLWNRNTAVWNEKEDRKHLCRGKRISGQEQIPSVARFLNLTGEIRTKFNPHSSLFNTDGQIFSDTGIPVVLFMENYDINRTGYHDTKDTMENIDLDYGTAFAAIAIETVARVATVQNIDF